MNIMYINLNKWLKLQNMSKYALEKRAGFIKGTIKKWEISMPAWDKILKVANVLDISVDYLLGNTQNPKSHKNNPEDCVAAMQELKKAIDNFSTITTEASAKGQSEIDRILTRFHIDPHL